MEGFPKLGRHKACASKPTPALLALSVVTLSLVAGNAEMFPPTDQNPLLEGPVRTWDEALPLGNGRLGGLLWGEGKVIRLSLDRGDLWDERTHGEPEWWKNHPWTEAAGKGDPWDRYYHGVTPTKLPAGRLEITLAGEASAQAFELNLATAEGIARLSDGTQLRAFFSAAAPVVLMRIPGAAPALELLPAGAGKEGDAGPSSGGAVSKLGYPPPERGAEGNTKWYIQNGIDGFQYVVWIQAVPAGGETLLALAIASTKDLASDSEFPDPLALARARCARAVAEGYDRMLKPHAAWWREFWAGSSVSLPEPGLQRYYQFARYLYGAGSRRGAPPMPLQGVWTADNGGLPPWKGDYHNDLNTQIPNSNYDLMCMKMLFLALVEMADAQGKQHDASRWAELAAGLGDFHAGPDGELMLDAREFLNESHRHLSNLIGIHPFNLITIEGSAADRQRIRASVAKWDRLGTSQWCGYSWAWMSCLRARVADREAALRHFDVFVHAFVTRNGFHVNGDQTKSGYSGMTYRPFTLEGNFIAMQAVHEMLLQGWSPTPGRRDTEVIRVFPATAWRWHEVSFTGLRAEGGHRVSAKRERNATTWLRVVAGKDGELRIRDNFGGRTPRWSQPVATTGDNFVVSLKKGEAIEAKLPVPEETPAPPADLAAPVVSKGR